MEKNIILKFIAESQIDGSLSDMEQFKQAIDAAVKKLEGMQSVHKKGSKEWKEYGTVIEGVKQEFKEIEAEIGKSGKSIEEYAKKFGKINSRMAEGAVSTPKFTTQLRMMKDELSKLEAEGIDPTDKGFISLAVKAAQMEDQIGDTQQRIRHLASDTKNLDAALDVGSGLAGAFSIATSSAALLGGESEELQQAFFKVQAALSILNGVQQVANFLNKDSIANVVIGTAVEETNTVAKIKNGVATKANAVITALEAKATAGSTTAKIGATVAQKALNLAMKANPAGIILTAIVALAGALLLFARRGDTAKQAQERLNFELERTNVEIENIKSEGDFNIEMARAAGMSAKAVREMALSIAKDAESVASSSLMMVRSAYAVGNATKEQYEQATKTYQDAVANYTSVFRQGLIAEARERKEASDRANDAAKEARSKAIDAAKQRAQEIADAEKELQNVTLEQMQEGQFKEIEQIRLNYERRIAEVKGNSETEIELRKQLKQLEQREVEAIELKYAKEEKERAAEAAEKKAKEIADAIKAEIEILKLSANERIAIERHNAEMVIASSKSSYAQKKQAEDKLRELDRQKLDEEGDFLKMQLENNLITVEDYEQNVFDLKEQYRKLDLEKIREKAEYEKELQQAVFDFGVQLVQMGFDFKKEKLQQEMEDLDHFYTTDPDEAKKSADKKLITEQALAQKKLEIKRKQAQVEKNEALFQIAINTAQAIMASLAKYPLPAGLPFMLMNSAMGLVQAGMVMSKPLPKYAKGRKGGKGEFAMVGELGPEVMWVPDGASIVPNGKKLTPDVLEMFGIPKLLDIDRNVTLSHTMKGGEIDYQKLGKAVADNIKYPDNKPVTVNVDGSGVTVRDGRSTTKYLNKKYRGDW